MLAGSKEATIISGKISELKSIWLGLNEEERKKKLVGLHLMLAESSPIIQEAVLNDIVPDLEEEIGYRGGLMAAKVILVKNKNNGDLQAELEAIDIDDLTGNEYRSAIIKEFVDKIATIESDSEVESYVNTLSERLNLNKRELKAVYSDLAKLRKKSIKKSQADRIVELVLNEEVELFHDTERETYARVRQNNRFAIYRIKSKGFKAYLAGLFYREHRKVANSEAKQSALNTLEAIALYENVKYKLNLRVAEHEKAIWFDLGDWRAVKITQEEWEIIEAPPILFRKYSHQQVQVEPARNGDLRKVLAFVNLKKDEDKLLLLAYLVAALVPDIPHPVIILHGVQGAAKSTLFKIIREIIDPSFVANLTFSKDFAQFAQAASHHYCVFLDNLTHLPDWLSDCFCRLCTGDGFTKRELFTDDDDIVYAFKRLGGINGINLVVNRADLLDRSLIFELDEISEDKRITEKSFWQNFTQAKPKILGGLFDTLSIAMKKYNNITLKALPRMADFALWGCAVARALGYNDNDFLKTYKINISRQNEEAISASPVAQAVIAFMDNKNQWEDSSSNLLTELTTVAETLKLDIKSRYWPKDPRWLWKRIKEVRTNLAPEGIFASKPEGGKTEERRKIILTRQDKKNDVLDVLDVPGQDRQGFTGDIKGTTRDINNIVNVPAVLSLDKDDDSRTLGDIKTVNLSGNDENLLTSDPYIPVEGEEIII